MGYNQLNVYNTYQSLKNYEKLDDIKTEVIY